MSNFIDGPSCKLQFCAFCKKIVNKSIRGRKVTCSDECATAYQRLVWNRQHAEKMAKDPEYAKKQSALQYARIKADPDKLKEFREITKVRRQLPNYKESFTKGAKKYRSTVEFKEKNARKMRKYRDENPEVIAKIEAERNARRSAERERLKIEEPEKYQALLEQEAEYHRNLRAEKRLAELQKDLKELVNKDE